MVRAQEGELLKLSLYSIVEAFLVYIIMNFTVYILYLKKWVKNYIWFPENLIQRLEFHFNEEQTRKFTYRTNDYVLI